MTAIAAAESLYRQNYPDRLFVERLAHFLRSGIVINLPELFVMARPVPADVTDGELADPATVFKRPTPALYVDLAVGPGGLRWIADMLDRTGGYVSVCFYRKFRSGLRCYPAAHLRERFAL